MPSRAAARGMWDSSAREAYRAAGKGVSSAYAACVQVAGDTVTINRGCLKNAGKALKGPLSGAWTE